MKRFCRSISKTFLKIAGGEMQRWAFLKNWLKRSATKRKSSVKS